MSLKNNFSQLKVNNWEFTCKQRFVEAASTKYERLMLHSGAIVQSKQVKNSNIDEIQISILL